MDYATRATVEQMEAEEGRLLELRSRARQRTASAFLRFRDRVGFRFGCGLLVRSRIHRQPRDRHQREGASQVNALNAQLQQRVSERTAELRESEDRISQTSSSRPRTQLLQRMTSSAFVVFNSRGTKRRSGALRRGLGQPVTRFIPRRFHQRMTHISEVRENGATVGHGAMGALWGVRADGEEFPIEASISQVARPGTTIHGNSARYHRASAEEERGWLAAIVESSDDAIISKTLEGVITAWNRGAEKNFGYSSSEAIGKPMMMLIPSERVSEESDILGRIRRGESVKHFETVRLRKDGTRVDISEAISPIRDASGETVGASKIARDITDAQGNPRRYCGRAKNGSGCLLNMPLQPWQCLTGRCATCT